MAVEAIRINGIKNRQRNENFEKKENSEIPMFFKPEIKIQEMLISRFKKSIKLNITSQKLNLDSPYPIKTSTGVVFAHKVCTSLDTSFNKSELPAERVSEDISCNELYDHRKRTNSRPPTRIALTQGLIEMSAKNSKNNRRRSSLFKIEAEKDQYRKYLQLLECSDKKKALTILAPRIDVSLFKETKGPIVIRSSKRKKVNILKNDEDKMLMIIKENFEKKQKESMCAISELEDENKSYSKFETSLRRWSKDSSLMVDKIDTPLMNRKSKFSTGNRTPLTKAHGEILFNILD